jgi:sterol desaturase/sphingolipid hydroxylase (fatty acid hydroxylase superfamily)
MSPSDPVQSILFTVGTIVAAMAIVALVELAIPLQRRGHWSKAHLVPNLALTAITFATSALFNAGLVAVLFWLEADRLGMLPLLALPSLAAAAIAVVVLDFSFYVAHVAMHHGAMLWRFHRVHHADPAVDVTTTIRQHPGEAVIRYAFMAAFAIVLGAPPAAFAVYRVWSALNGLLEHANIRVSRRLDAVLALVITSPNMHKVHHSRVPAETDTNYGNIFSIFDRLFRTFTPTERGERIAYGLAGFDDPSSQTTGGLLVSPFREIPSLADLATASR